VALETKIRTIEFDYFRKYTETNKHAMGNKTLLKK
jgi:hypothetical protein